MGQDLVAFVVGVADVGILAIEAAHQQHVRRATVAPVAGLQPFAGRAFAAFVQGADPHPQAAAWLQIVDEARPLDLTKDRRLPSPFPGRD